MSTLKFRHVVVALLSIVGLAVVLFVGVMGGAMLAGFASAVRSNPAPVEVVHYVPRSASAPVPGTAPDAPPVEPR